ncbi:metal-dependent hydrolase [Longimicrobium sp.]|uniref:metal-dependent hydrolase n=1 Tax=Longimicrobium sp. TaxID=2029185 RepID=UPI003B3B9AFA
MFIAHLPAGYLATRLIIDRPSPPELLRGRLLALGMIASVVPDLDLLWFYFVSDRQQVHHAYLPHLPLAWIPVFAAAVLVLWIRRAGRPAWLGMWVVAANILLHQVMDTTAGGIRWLWPFSRAEFVMSHVEARYQPWYLNFVLHWTFVLEVAILVAALWYARRRSVARR